MAIYQLKLYILKLFEVVGGIKIITFNNYRGEQFGI